MKTPINRPADVPPETWDKFIAYHRDNPGVWAEFERFSLSAAKSGRKLGAKAIAERVRWETEIERGEEFKFCNSYVSYYARIFAAKYPEHRDYFEFRPIKGLAA